MREADELSLEVKAVQSRSLRHPDTDTGAADAAELVDGLPVNPRTVSRRKRAAPAKEAMVSTIVFTASKSV